MTTTPPEPLRRFLSHVEFTPTCWLWTGSLNYAGYAQASLGGRRDGAHRVAYRLMRGPIAEGLEVDHLCRVRHCVNPAHLEVTTHRENTLRGDTITARQLAQTHCKRGHPLSGSNLRMSKGKRYCEACRAFHKGPHNAKGVAA